jgi:hypothetical protein
MILAEDVVGETGALFVAKGQEVSQSLVMRLEGLVSMGTVKQPFLVLLPLTGGASATQAAEHPAAA